MQCSRRYFGRCACDDTKAPCCVARWVCLCEYIHSFFSFFTAYDVLKKTTTINPVVACASSASITGIAWGGIFGGVRTAAKAAAVFPMIALVGFYAHDRADEWRRAEALKRARESSLMKTAGTNDSRDLCICPDDRGSFYWY